MVEKSKAPIPPYVAFSSFLNFISKMAVDGLPDRIDKSVFGGASGSVTYSTINALKFLNLIDEDGSPTELFHNLVNAQEEDRPALLRDTIQRGYSFLFNGTLNLEKITASQFDEKIRENFDSQGSTLDKIASFFILAAKHTQIPISSHLEKRKPIASSPTSRKSVRQRKSSAALKSGSSEERNLPPAEPVREKPLEYQLIDLMSEPDIEDTVKQSIWSLVQYLTARKAKTATEDE